MALQSLAPFSTGRLRQEIKEREDKARLETEARRKANEIEVICPICQGKGETEQEAWNSGGMTYMGACSTCNKTGHITAQKYG